MKAALIIAGLIAVYGWMQQRDESEQSIQLACPIKGACNDQLVSIR